MLYAATVATLRKLLLLSTLLISISAVAQFDTHFWMPPIWETGSNPQNDPSELFITTQFDFVEVHIESADGVTFIYDGLVSSGSPLLVELSPNLGQTDVSNTVDTTNGLIITSNLPIQVAHRVISNTSQSLISLKGTTALGREFWCGSQVRNEFINNNATSRHFVSVMALEDNTQITFNTPFAMDDGSGGNLPNPFVLNLDAKESYVIIGLATDEYVTGALVTGTKDIVVNSGSAFTPATGSSGNNGADSGIDQLIPIDYAGTTFGIVRGNNTGILDYAFVVATEDNTEITLDADLAPIATIDAGEFYDFTVPGGLGSGHSIHTSLPSFVYHVSGASDDDEVDMSLIPALGCIGSRYLELSLFEDNVNQFMQLIVSDNAADNLTINGVDYTTLPGLIEGPLAGLTGWRAATIPESALSANNVIEADGLFHAAWLAGTEVNGGYGFFSKFNDGFDFFDPVTELPTNIYTMPVMCGGEDVDHCILALSCGTDLNITGFSGNDGTVTITPVTMPFDTCFNYLAPFDYGGSDTVTFFLSDVLGNEGSIDIVFPVVNQNYPIDAGTPQELCDETSGTLSAVDPDPLGNGQWSVLGGGSAIITDPNSPTTTVTNLQLGTNSFLWTQFYPCGNNISITQISIFEGNPPVADAGVDVELCSDNNTYNMLANDPGTTATGTWEVVAGTATVWDINDAGALITNLAIGQNDFEWNIDNGDCAGGASVDPMSIFVFDQNHAPSDAGPDQEFCDDVFIQADLAGSTPTFPATGEWQVVSGSGTFDDDTDPNTFITGLGAGVNVFAWVIDNGPCGTLTDEIIITLFDATVASPNAGPDGGLCTPTTSWSLVANEYTLPALGTWTVSAGSGVFGDENDGTTTVTNLSIGPNTFTWTLDNGPCSNTGESDDVTIIVYDGSQIDADAGPDQEFCSNVFVSATLDASTVTAPGTGTWTVVQGSGNFTDDSDPATTVDGLSNGINEFQWTVGNGPCNFPTIDTVVITIFDSSQGGADAGTDVEFCTPISTHTMDATPVPAPAQGEWTLESGTGTIDNINDPNSDISGLGVGVNVFRWSIVNGPCPAGTNFDEMTISIFDENVLPADAGPDQDFCFNPAVPLTATMDASAFVTPGTGTWTPISGGGNITDLTDPTTTITSLPIGTNVFEWTVANGPCIPTTTSDQISIFVFDNNQDFADAGPDQNVCSDAPDATMAANAVTSPGVGTWTIQAGGGTIADDNDPTTDITAMPVGSNVFRWSIDNGPCVPPTTLDEVTILVFDASLVTALAGPDQDICSDQATVTMAANTPISPATGQWAVTQGSGTFDDDTDPDSDLSAMGVGVNIFEWQVNNGPCSGSTTDQMSVSVFDENQDAADAGPDQEFCTPTSTATMAANTITIAGTGTWALVSGTGTVTDTNDPNSGVTGLTIGENIFSWTVGNGPCVPSTTIDQMSIFIFDGTAPVADAGLDQSYCTPVSSTTMTGNNAVFPATGQWVFVSGSGTIVSPSNPNTQITDLAVGENIFEWQIDSGPCPDAVTTDQVSVFIFDQNQADAAAGPDQIFCSPISTATMAGSSITFPGSGQWTLISGTGTITDGANPLTGITAMSIGENIFEWTVDNGPCGPATGDQVSLFVYDDSAPDAGAGLDQDLCTPTTSTNMTANSATDPGVGTWTLISGSGSIIDENDPTTLITGLAVGDNVFQWEIDNGGCSNGTTNDLVSIFVYFDGQADAAAGPYQDLCTPITSTFLAANSVTFPATGTWTLISGVGTLTDDNDPNTEVTALGIGINIFEWTVDNGPCPNATTTDQVSISLFDGGFPEPDAGPDQELCSPTSGTFMAADPAVLPGIGTWTLVSGSGIPVSPNDPNTAITGLTIGVNTFAWTMDYATCGQPSDEVDIIVYDNTVAPSNAGPDQEICTPTSSVNMAADAIAPPGDGTWSLFSGTGTITDVNDPSSAIDNLTVGENIFVWTVYNGPCLIAPNTTDTISIFVFDNLQDPAEAGEDQEWCTPISSTNLDGNPVTFPAVGTWTLDSGTGTITDPNDPFTEVTGILVGESFFTWTIVNGSCPGSTTSDDVSIFIFDENQADADAGPDQMLCTPVSNVTLDGNELTFPASGEWVLLNGTGTILDPTDPNTVVTGVAVGESVFQWTISNGPCEDPTSDIVSIFIFDQFNDDADAGPDQEICTPESTTNLEGNVPVFPAIGTWTLVSGTGVITNPNDPATEVTGLTVGENVFMWSVDNGPCANGVTTDTVSIFVFDEFAPLADAGPDQEFCTPASSTLLNATTPLFPGSGSWTLVGGTGVIVSPTDPNTQVTGLTIGENIFEWTVYNGPCATTNSTDQVSIFIFDETQLDADAGADQQLCLPSISTLLNGNPVTFPAVGTWTIITGSATILDENDPNTLVTDLAIGTNTFVWTIENGPCLNSLTTDNVIIELFDNNFPDAYAGEDQEWCLPTNFATLDADDLSDPVTGIWTVIQGGGDILDATSDITAVTNIPVGENIYEWTVDNGPCGTTADQILIFIYDPDAPVADAGPDQEFCTPVSTTVMAGNTPGDPGVGTWELAGGTGTIDAPNSPTTDISGLTIGDNIFTWSIYNGPCEDPTIDSMSVFIFDENHPPAFAGNDVELCLPLDSLQMDGSDPIFPAGGTWELIGGSATIDEINNPNTWIDDLQLGTNTFVWTIDNLPCIDGVTSDTINVLVFHEDFPAPFAGDDQAFCSPIATTVLDADALEDPNTGEWSVNMGSGVFGDDTDPNTIVSGLTVGVNEFVWSVYNGPCLVPNAADTVQVLIYDQNHPPADAGDDQELCLPISTALMNGTVPIVPAIGTWMLVSGGGDVFDVNDPNTVVTNLPLGINVFSWTIENGPCENSITTDLVTITVYEDGALDAFAGEDIEICTPESCVTLDATPPSIPTVGTWTWVQGGGTISDINDPNAEVCALVVGHHILQWEVYNGPCAKGNTFDFVDIFVFDGTNLPAYAGEDQEMCWPSDSTGLEAATPIFPAIGTWELIAGIGDISDLNNPNADFTDSEIGTNILTWSVYNGPCADPTIDTVMITIFDPLSPDADAGEDQWFCTLFGGATMAGNVPIDPAVGTWELISGAGDISQPNIPTTTVLNLGLGQNILTWSIYNGACANSFTIDTVNIFVNDASMADANAGPDLFFCGTLDSLQMDGSETIGNTAFGLWTTITGGGDFADLMNEHTYVYDVPLGLNTYVWTVDNGACGISTDSIEILIYDPGLPEAFAGPDQEFCEDEFQPFELSGSEVAFPANAFWEIYEGPVEISDDLDPNATVNYLGDLFDPDDVETSTLVWTVDNGVCGTSSDSVTYVMVDCLSIEVPDAFSPNGDGVNDVWEIPNLFKYPNNTVKIYNRWGALLYEASPYWENWDGRSHHPATMGTELPVSTYYYIIDLGDGPEQITGWVYLKR